jgi:hypothetical protein
MPSAKNPPFELPPENAIPPSADSKNNVQRDKGCRGYARRGSSPKGRLMVLSASVAAYTRLHDCAVPANGNSTCHSFLVHGQCTIASACALRAN